MIITDFLERNARLYGSQSSLVEINPSEERDKAATWWDFNLIESAGQDAPYRRELSWKDFDRQANRFANLLLSRGLKRGTKVAVLLMNCLEWLPVYFGILKAGCVAVPMNFRYSSDEIKYCLELADVEVLIFGPEFISRIDSIVDQMNSVKMRFFVGSEGPAYSEDCMTLMGFCSSSAPPIALEETDDAAIYFSSGTTGFPKAILHNHRALVHACLTEQNHHSQSCEDVFLCIPPLYHTGAKMHWFGSLLSGSKAVLLRGVKPEWILRAVDDGRVDLSKYRLSQWRLMHIGAQPVPPSLIHRWMKVFPHHQYDTNYVRFGDKVYSPVIDKGQADFIVSFELLEAARWTEYLKPGGKIIANTQQINPMPVIIGAAQYPEALAEKIVAAGIDLDAIDALTLAEEAGSAKAVNLVLMGRLSKYFDFTAEEWMTAIERSVPPKFLEMNKKAFALGAQA